RGTGNADRGLGQRNRREPDAVGAGREHAGGSAPRRDAVDRLGRHRGPGALEIECPEPDDVLRLVEETSGDDAVLGWSPAPKEIPAAWFMSDDAYLPGSDW